MNDKFNDFGDYLIYPNQVDYPVHQYPINIYHTTGFAKPPNQHPCRHACPKPNCKYCYPRQRYWYRHVNTRPYYLNYLDEQVPLTYFDRRSAQDDIHFN